MAPAPFLPPEEFLTWEEKIVREALGIERERIATLIAQFDDFVYHDPEWATGSVVDERPSMERLAALVRSGK